MFRAAKTPVVVPVGVDIKVNGQAITIRGKNDELTRTLNDTVEVKHVDNALTFGPRDDYVNRWAQAGTTRALLNSMVIGVTEGFTKKLQLVGVGYRAVVKGDVVSLALSFSHPVEHELPTSITAECPTQTEIVLKGANKQVIGQVAADPRVYRHPEPCRGKDVRYADEVVCIKEARKGQGNTMDKKSAHIRRVTHAHRKLQELGATRLVVCRTPRRIYAQVIAPDNSEVLAAVSTVEKAISERLKYTGNKDVAAVVGKTAAGHALEKGIKDVSFDRSGFQCHGRVQALADAACEAGLQF